MSWGSIDGAGQDVGSGGAEGQKNAGGEAQAGNAAGGNGGLAGAKGPCVLYFCSEQLGQTAGLGTVALAARVKQGVKLGKPTIFESMSVMLAFKKAGLTDFRKVVIAKETLAVAKKFNVTQDNTMLICAPSGEVIAGLAGAQCGQTNVLKLLKSWPDIYEAWQKKNAAK